MDLFISAGYAILAISVRVGKDEKQTCSLFPVVAAPAAAADEMEKITLEAQDPGFIFEWKLGQNGPDFTNEIKTPGNQGLAQATQEDRKELELDTRKILSDRVGNRKKRISQDRIKLEETENIKEIERFHVLPENQH